MNGLFVELLPMIRGAALAPLWIIIVLLLLASPQGLVKAVLFVLGMTLVRLAQGVIFGAVFAASPDAAGDSGASPVAATLMLVLGVLLLVASYRKWAKVEDPDEPPPQWMQRLEQATPLRALLMGVVLVSVGVKLWAFTLSALGVIRASGLGQTQSVIAYLIYIVLAQLLLLLPILFSAAASQTAGATLQRATRLLTDYNRPILIIVTLVFGGLLWLERAEWTDQILSATYREALSHAAKVERAP